MFSYHNTLKKLLKEQTYFVEKQQGTFAYRFHFPLLNKSFPIREYRVNEYMEYIKHT